MLERYCPPGVFDTTSLGFPQLVVAPAGTLLFTNSVALDEQLRVIGLGDFGAQMRQALLNLRIILESAGCTPADIAQMRINVVGMTNETRLTVLSELELFYGASPRASNALIGVDRLARPELLVEIEIVAIRY